MGFINTVCLTVETGFQKMNGVQKIHLLIRLNCPNL